MEEEKQHCLAQLSFLLSAHVTWRSCNTTPKYLVAKIKHRIPPKNYWDLNFPVPAHQEMLLV